MSCYQFDVEHGIVFGLRGAPITKRAGGGYIQVNRGGKPVGMAHRMLWEHVHGPIQEGMQINHKNGIKTDNRLENLEVVTPSENTKHAYLTGLASALGEKNGRAKLTADAVKEIRDSSLSVRELSEKYGVAMRTIREVVSRKNWGHVQ